MGSDDSALVIAAKRKKNGYRLAVSNHLAKFDDQNKGKVSDEELLESIRKLRDLLATLEQLDSEIIAETDATGIAKICDDAVSFSQDASDRIYKAEAIMAARKQHQPRPALQASASTHSQDNDLAPMVIKLPPLSIQKYDGNPLRWREFWDSFRSSIDSQPNLSPVEKFKYLKHYLTGEAEVLAEQYPLCDDTYAEVVDVLKQRFGDEECAIFAHIDQLLTLSKASNDIEDIQRVLDKCESHIRGLKALGVDEETSSRYNIPIILSKFPTYIRTEVYSRNGMEKWTLANLRKHLREELTARQMGSVALGEKNASTEREHRNRSGKLATADYSSRRHRRRSSSVSEDYDDSADAETAMLTSAKTTKGKTSSSDINFRRFPCFYCRGSHFPDECDQYTDLELRLRMVKDSCMLCLNRKHKTEQCWHQERPCYHCNSAGEHHRSLCPRKFGGKQKTETCYLATERKATDRKFLPTACATAKGETCSAKVHLLLDQCAERSFGKIGTLRKLGAKLIRYEAAAIAGIQSERVRTVCYPIYELKVLTQKRSITITVSGVKSVSAPLDRPCLTDQDILFPSDLRVNDSVNAESCLIDLDLLIGLDHYYDFVSYGQVILGSGLFLQNTELGYVLTGCLKDTSSSSRTEAVLLATEASASTSTLLSPGRTSLEESPTWKSDFTACVN